MKKDNTGKNEHNERDRPTPSYTPKQRAAILKGLRILAKVAVRAHMRRQAARSHPGQDGDGGEEG